MNCLKCGRETEEEQAFCLECQKDMAKYPIDPNAVVQLPVRKQVPQKKPLKRKAPPEEQVKVLKRRVHIFACLFFAALIAIVCLSIPVIRNYDKNRFQIGQNYSTVKHTAPPADSTASSE